MGLFRQRFMESQGFEKSTTVIRHCNLNNAGSRVVLGRDPDGGMAISLSLRVGHGITHQLAQRIFDRYEKLKSIHGRLIIRLFSATQRTRYCPSQQLQRFLRVFLSRDPGQFAHFAFGAVTHLCAEVHAVYVKVLKKSIRCR